MGGIFSKKRDDEAPSVRINSQHAADLSSYEAACRLDPDLQSFDTNVQERTNRVINTLAVGVEVGVEVRSLSFDSLREVTDCLLEMNQEVVKVILECKKDIWKCKELFDLVEEYFDNSLRTLEFCTVLDKCLKRARDSQLIVQVALQRFEEEEKDGVGENKHWKTLQELRNFKAAGKPFSDDFFELFQSVYSGQKLMLEKLRQRKRKLDKKLKSLQGWRKVSTIIFVSAFVAVLIFSVVAAAIAAPPVVTALAGALAVPIGSMGKWFDSIWKKYEKELKGRREIISSMQVGSLIAIKDLEDIRVLVEKLEIDIESLLQNADFAIQEEDAVKLVIEEIKKKLHGFMETIEMLGQNTDKCSRDIRRARTVILQRIIRRPNSNN